MIVEKELWGKNGAFDTETAGFGGGVGVRSARKRQKSEKCSKKMRLCGPRRSQRREILEGPEIGVAGRRKRCFLECLKGNGENESFKRRNWSMSLQ